MNAYDRDIVAAHEAGHFATIAHYGGKHPIYTMKIRAGDRRGGYVRSYSNRTKDSVYAISNLAGAMWSVLAGVDWDHKDFRIACRTDVEKWYWNKHHLTHGKNFEALKKALLVATPEEISAVECVILGLGLDDDEVTRGALVLSARLYKTKKAFREHVIRETRRGRQQWGAALTTEMCDCYFEK